jgi:hypothetical protein
MARSPIKQRTAPEVVVAPVRKAARATLGFAVDQVNRKLRQSKKATLDYTLGKLKGK